MLCEKLLKNKCCLLESLRYTLSETQPLSVLNFLIDAIFY